MSLDTFLQLLRAEMPQISDDLPSLLL